MKGRQFGHFFVLSGGMIRLDIMNYECDTCHFLTNNISQAVLRVGYWYFLAIKIIWQILWLHVSLTF
jgi:hypothetical protein